jgi:UDP-N-acetylenolpyruvoylglucosamine reductase
MRLGGAARYVIEIEEDKDLADAYRFAREKDLPTYVLGGGSNVIGRDGGFPGVILVNKLRGIYVIDSDKDSIRLCAKSGELLDDFVKYSVTLWNGEFAGWCGVEALAKIPGTVGAAPVQNVGAYGQDISQTLHSVCVYDQKDNLFKHMMAEELDLGYRHSIFNTGDGVGRYFITSVTLELHKNWMKPPFYTSLQAYFDEHGITEFNPQVIYDGVAAVRAGKLPDPAEFASAGSFFKNVYLDEKAAKEAEAKGIPVWEGGKVPSGWLIEHAGLKGKEFYGMRVSDKAALVLINESAKSYADLAKARQAVIDAVYEKYGLTLEQEPMELGE